MGHSRIVGDLVMDTPIKEHSDEVEVCDFCGIKTEFRCNVCDSCFDKMPTDIWIFADTSFENFEVGS